jgi:hypothetical protein
MARRSPFTTAAINAFEATFDEAREAFAFQTRGEFLKAFPIRRLGDLSIDNYVIGLNAPTFCYYVEVRTRAWANIHGATSFKFGIYFGKTKSDPRSIYRFTKKFGTTGEGAFAAVKEALLDLVREGSQSEPDFAAIDDSPLSQMFKAKILGLYFQERFLSVCSGEHLERLRSVLDLPGGLPLSEYQNRLLKVKLDHPATREWTNPKFTEFLYNTYIPKERYAVNRIEKPRVKSHHRVNFEDIQNERSRIGKKAEDFPLGWEKDRLRGADLEHLIPAIDDRRDRPSYGYDFFRMMRSDDLDSSRSNQCVNWPRGSGSSCRRMNAPSRAL